MKLTRAMVDSYRMVAVIPDWNDRTLAEHGLNGNDLFYAMMVTGSITDFAKRTGLQREDVALIVNASTGSVYPQWRYAAGNPLSTEPAQPPQYPNCPELPQQKP